MYTPGLEGDCGDPLCCRPPVAVGTRRPAGIFGDFRCDAPRTLLVDVYDFIANRAGLPPIDYVVWTGDIPPHDVHESTREAYTALMEDQAQLLAEYFPSALVLGAIGNHESVPVDQFAPRTIPGLPPPSSHLVPVRRGRVRALTLTDTLSGLGRRLGPRWIGPAQSPSLLRSGSTMSWHSSGAGGFLRTRSPSCGGPAASRSCWSRSVLPHALLCPDERWDQLPWPPWSPDAVQPVPFRRTHRRPAMARVCAWYRSTTKAARTTTFGCA